MAIMKSWMSILMLLLSRDGQRLATASFDGTIKVWAVGPEAPGRDKAKPPEPKKADN